jgi:hypothetical protein
MAVRYTVRAHPSAGHYYVWDYEKNAVATSGDRTFDDLPLQEALDAADKLNRSEPKKE